VKASASSAPRHDFEHGWQATRAPGQIPPLDREVAGLLTRARELALAVDDVIADETGAWITEFRTSLERVERGLARADRQ
jgi:hypothetical protein